MTQAERILGKFPSERKLAKHLGLAQQTVNGWKRVGYIPAWWQQKVLDAGPVFDVELHPGDFFEQAG